MERGAGVSAVLAAIDASAAARPVLQVARSLGRALGLPVVGLHVRQDGDDPPRLLAGRAGVELRLAGGVPAEEIVAGLGGADVALAVLGVRGNPAGRRPAGSTALAVATRAAKPVVVVPPEPFDPPPAGLHRVLVPLDGTADAARAVEEAMGWFAGSGVEVVSLHVFDAATVPRFWDRPEHDHAAWTGEFLARNVPAAGARLEVRSGWPADRILEVATAERADMIALGWHRRLAPDRAAVVREVLARTPVPVILLPWPG
jgi:nucleotide-binding universal stress UspA family protein